MPAQDSGDQRTSDGYRPGETDAERDDRNLAELLQELRVAGLGIQVIFGYLLALPFTSKFSAARIRPAHALHRDACCSPPSPRRCCSARSPTTGWCSAAI